MRFSVRMAIAIALVAGLTGCATDTGTDGPEWPDLPPDLSLSPDAVVVIGTGQCSMRNTGFEEIDGVFYVTEVFSCADTMSDPRVTGTQDFVSVTKYVDENTGGIWFAEEMTLTTDEGTWRGTGWGIVDLEGVLPWAEGLWPFNYGEAHYTGEGPYEGLEYHYFVAGSNNQAAVTGWINTVEP